MIKSNGKLALALLLAGALPLGALASGGAPTSAARSAARSVVLISIDGLKPEYVLQADAHRLRIPHLRAMLGRGAYARGVVGVVPTVTYPSHTTLVTAAVVLRENSPALRDSVGRLLQLPAGRDLGVVDQRAIAPTLARLLGVTLTGEVPALLP